MMPDDPVRPEPASMMDLQRALAAKDRTLQVLMAEQARRQSMSTPALAVLEQNAALHRVVRAKTVELEVERGKLETALEKLKATQAQLLQVHKLEAIGTLAAGVAHEINTPVQYTSDNVQFLGTAFSRLLAVAVAAQELLLAEPSLADGEPGKKLQACLTQARVDWMQRQVPRALEQSADGLRRVATIVAAMKSFSHPSGGTLQLADLADIIQTTVTVARNEWKYVAELVTDFDGQLDQVPCLRDELSQVILNLVVNAAHAIGEKQAGVAKQEPGLISISTRRTGTHAEIRVSDTGTGIPPAAQPHIFEPFFTTKPVGKGTGQGLAIAYGVVVDKHHGTISFETEPGIGTTFIVRLPLRTAPGEGALEAVTGRAGGLP